MSSKDITGLKVGHEVFIFAVPPKKCERSFVYFVGNDLIITNLGTVITKDSEVTTIIATSKDNSNFPVSESAKQAKTNYLLAYHSDIPNPPPEPE